MVSPRRWCKLRLGEKPYSRDWGRGKRKEIGLLQGLSIKSSTCSSSSICPQRLPTGGEMGLVRHGISGSQISS